MFSKNNKIISVIDIGGTKIVCIIAKITKHGTEIIGVGSNASEGIRYGIITDVKLFRARVASAVHEAEQKAKKHIDTATINIANPLIKSHFTKLITQFNGKQVLAQDMKRVERKAVEKVDILKNEILYVSTLWHDLDEITEIFDPEFMFVNTMVSYINLVTIPVKYLVNLTASLLGCQIKISSIFMNAYASSVVCTSDEERMEGCIIADIGGETLDYAVIKNNTIVDIGTIPLGGNTITSDIANYFGISTKDAERVKILNGQLYDFMHYEGLVNTSLDSVPMKQISRLELSEVISARFEEIISVFLEKIARHRHISNSVIFTGGVSKTLGLQDFMHRKFNITSKIGTPMYPVTSTEIDLDPVMSTALGMLKLSASTELPKNAPKNKEYSVKSALAWLKENF